MRLEWQMWCDESNILCKEDCDEIVERALKMPGVPATVGTMGEVPGIRSSVVRWLDRQNPDFTEICDFVEARIREANRNAFGFDISYLPALQFTTYSANDNAFYRYHVDTFFGWQNGRPKPTMTDRKISFMLQLSDPSTYKGGNLELESYPVPDCELLRRQGTAIAFPSLLRHQVTPITQGVRYSLVGWMEGPFWR